MKYCPKLEKLFLNGNIEANTFFANLSEYIPTARNLRDLRYFLKNKSGYALYFLKLISLTGFNGQAYKRICLIWLPSSRPSSVLRLWRDLCCML